MSNRYREEEKAEISSDEALTDSNTDEVLEEVTLDDSNAVDNSNELESENKALKAELNKYKEQYLRTLAEAENFKKRINEERIRERKYFSQGLIEKFVNALDIFDRTINFKTDDEKLKNFLIGFEMINNNLKQILADEGVKLIESIGKKFDPTFHHAIDTDSNEEKEDGVILEEVQRGYMYKDRVLRAALVKVNKLNKEEK